MKGALLTAASLIALQVLSTIGYTQLPNYSRYSSHGIFAEPDHFRLQKYILFTTQRSGSTWVCQLLNLQPSITCGIEGRSELMISYSRRIEENKNIQWETYRADFLNAVRDASDVARGRQSEGFSHVAAGFKLMYDQVPQQFMTNFLCLLEEEEIVVLHLVREAKILKLASKYNNAEQKQMFGGMHTTNVSEAQLYRRAKLLKWDNNTILQILKLEKESAYWEQTLRLSEYMIPVYYVSYEVLLRQQQMMRNIQRIISFLLPDTIIRLSEVQTNTSLLQLHEPSCIERVDQYFTLEEQPIFRDTRTALACKLLNSIGIQSQDFYDHDSKIHSV